MAVRVSKLIKELNIGMTTLESILNALGNKENYLSPNTSIPDDIAALVRGLYSDDKSLIKWIRIAVDKGVYGSQTGTTPYLRLVDNMDLDANHPRENTSILTENDTEPHTLPPLKYRKKQGFWVSELILLSPKEEVNSIVLGSFEHADKQPLFSVLIGTNGAGKSMLMKEIVDFFIDLHACVNGTDQRLPSTNKGHLKGIRYHIDGAECEVIKLQRYYFAKIDGNFCALKDLRLPSIVACHFGAFDKLPVQTINGFSQTRYDVPYYRYVGAHVTGGMISSSAIAFRLLFALNEQMDTRQRQNICSILDFIGYDHKVSLSYTFAQKAKKDGTAREAIAQRIEKDREYNNLSKQEKNNIVDQLYSFYNTKIATGKKRFDYHIRFDKDCTSGSYNELNYIYKLKQCNLVSSANVIFHKQGVDITSEDMSSGELAMLSTVLSISAAANDPHTLVLLDEPELSLHPNWQMTLIDNLDRALANKDCHLLIATHSHMLVSDLPLKRSSVTHAEKDENGNLNATTITESTYGWSAEEVLLKVFKTATDRNRYFGERIGKLLEQMGNNTISPEEVSGELKELQEISLHLSDIDPMKMVLNTIVEAYKL